MVDFPASHVSFGGGRVSLTSTLPFHDGFQPSSGIPPGAGVPHSPEATMILLVGGMVPGQQPDGGKKASIHR